MPMGYIFEPGNPMLNVAANSPFSSVVDIGKTIEGITFELGGTAFTKAHLTNLQLLAGSSPIIRDLTGAQLGKIVAYRGITDEAAYLTIPFVDNTGLDRVDKEVGAFDTSKGITSLSLLGDIGAATAPTLKHWVKRSAPQMIPTDLGNGKKGLAEAPYNGMMSKFIGLHWEASTSGSHPFKLPYGLDGTMIKRIHIEQATGGILTGVKCKEGSVIVHESTKLLNEHDLKDHKRVPQTNWYTVDFVLKGRIADAWDTRNSKSACNIFLEVSGAESGTIILEVIDELGNL